MSNKLYKNSVANAISTALGALLTFVLYRYISSELGASALGIWSVVLATASASRLADLGLASCVTSYVAKDIASGEYQRAALLIETVLISVFVLVLVAAVSVYPILKIVLSGIFNQTYLSEALELLPYALLSLPLMVLWSVIQSALDAAQEVTIKVYILILSQVLMVVGAVFFMPQYGLLGLAYAQIFQGILLVICGWFVLRLKFKNLSKFPVRWDKTIFLSVRSFAFKSQLISMIMICFDPLTKGLMAKFGGVSAAGYFEIANQVVVKARSLIVSANQVIVPRAAQLSSRLLVNMYEKNVRLLCIFSIPIYTVLFISADFISVLLVGENDMQFVTFERIITLGWFVNTFTFPAYFINVGTANINSNIHTHVIMGLINLVAGTILGSYFGGMGVVCAYFIALFISTLFLLISFHHYNKISFLAFFRLFDCKLCVVSSASVLFVMLNSGILHSSSTINGKEIAYLTLIILILALVTFFNPLINEIVARFSLDKYRDGIELDE